MIIDTANKIGDWFYLFTHMFSLLAWKDVVDIFLVAIIFYFIFVFIKQTRSFVIPYAVLAYLAVVYFAKTLDLGLTRQVFQLLTTVFLLIFIIIFQRELRRFFDWIFLSSRRLVHPQKRTLSSEVSFAIIKAVQEMVTKKIGALIVLPGELPLEGIIEGGFSLDGRVSSPLLLSIFDTSSPGHDGAIIIDNNRVKKFGVHLPLAENYSGFQKAGTRHRAAVGITERTDALAIVVSEERGEVSVAEGGQLQKITEYHLLEERISKFIYQSQEPEFDRFWRFFLIQNWRLKLVALVIALGLWFSLVFQAGVINKDIKVPVEARFLDNSHQVISIVPREVSVTLTGNNQDLNNFTEDQVKVFVDLKNATSGVQTIELNNANVDHPRYLNLIKIAPKSVKVKIDSSLKINNQ